MRLSFLINDVGQTALVTVLRAEEQELVVHVHEVVVVK